MVKEPRPGRVKTRLARDIGSVQAAWWFRHQSTSLIRRLSGDRRWQTLLAVAPDAEGLTSRNWPTSLPRIAQGRGDLGARMGRVFNRSGPGPTVIIGADIPGIRRAHIASAFTALGGHDAVFGPAFDGGYWLVGLKRPSPKPRHMFQGVRWSTEHTLADTRASLPDMRIALIACLHDVDTAADL
ncbi:MAG: glycosyltransferase [Alphaproteobacteria bacterium]|nr:glycosyltransferase [Alphaproteobacteria bacterium]